MITDDHKTTGASIGKQTSPLAPFANAPWSTPPEDGPVPLVKRKSNAKSGSESKKRAKPYDRTTKSMRKGTASGLASPASLTSDLPETRSVSPSQFTGNHTPISGVWPQPITQACPSGDPMPAPLPVPSADVLSSVLESLASPPTFLPTAPPSPVQQTISFQQSNTMAATIVPSSSFLYFDPAPTIQNLPHPIIHRLIPSSGPTTGGIEITVLGANFHPTIQLNCMFGDVVASSTQRWSDNTLLCILPPRMASGVVAVWFDGINKVEDGTPPVLFTYIDETDRAL
jgi:uncharacterized protein